MTLKGVSRNKVKVLEGVFKEGIFCKRQLHVSYTEGQFLERFFYKELDYPGTATLPFCKNGVLINYNTA